METNDDSKTRRIVLTDRAPLPIGPYSQAVKCGDMVFVSGQLGLNMKTKKLEPTVEAQAGTALTNLKAVLEAAGSGLNKVVKTTVFLADMADFPAVNAVYAGFFPEAPPARSTVQVAALPMGARVEIEAIAHL